MASKPLIVAVVAMGLLVVSVGFEVLFHRSYAIDVQTPDGWITIGGTGSDPYGLSRPAETSGGAIVEVARNDTITFRLRADNGYPWSLSEPYDVRVGGVIVAEGTIAADARSEGESTFTLRAALFLPRTTETPVPEKPGSTLGYFDVQIGDAFVSASFQVQEVSG